MKILAKTMAATALALAAVASPLAIAPAAAQASTVGVVNVQAIVANSTAYRTAQQQRPTTYAAQISAANTRRDQIAAQLQPMYAKYQTDAQAATPNQQALQQLAAQIQQIEQAAQRELQQILQPVALSQAYVEEQILEKMGAAIETAAKKKKMSLVISPDTVLYSEAALNLNEAVLAEINAALPAAQLVPPEGWLPRELREQQAQAQAQAAAQQGAAPAAAPAAAPVQGR